jgi:hypothetical protein
MKKTAVLLAGLLLVTGTVFAEGWEVTGAAVEGTLNIVDTVDGMDMEDGDANLTIGMTKEGDFGKLAAEYTFDKVAEGYGTAVELTYSKTEGDFGVQLGADVSFAGTSPVEFQTNEDSDTFLTWQVMGSEDMKLTVYPFEVDGMTWEEDTFDSFMAAENSGEGIAFAMTVAEGTTVTAKMTMNENGSNVNHSAYKFELATKVGEASVDAYFATRPENDDAGVTADTAMGAKASMPMGNLTLSGEFNTETIDDGDALTGLFAKASMAMDEMNGYTPTAYASFKSLNEYVDADGGGALTEIEAGVKMAQGSFYVTPKFVITTSEDEVYALEDDTDTEKSKMTAGVTFGYSM